MSATLGYQIVTILEAAVLLFVVVCSFLLLLRRRESMTVVFFSFSMVSLLLSLLYWVAYVFIHPEERLPLAPNEFAEAAGFLLMGSCLHCVFRERTTVARWEILLCVLFSAANICLWSAWNGYWTENLLTGPAYAYFLCACVRALKLSKALSRRSWLFLFAVSFLYVALAVLALFLPAIEETLWLSYYIVLFFGIGFFLFRSWQAIARNSDSRVLLSLSFSVYGWTITTMYASVEYWYNIAELVNIASLIFMLYAVQREVFRE